MNKSNVAQQTKAANFLPLAQGILQRKCACGKKTPAGGQCTACRQKKMNLQRQNTQPDRINKVPSVVHEVLGSSGRPLDTQTRAFMEPRFGQDFSQVRTHTTGRAAESANAVNAVAYTSGRNVAFARGQYAPQTMKGKQLLAHELTHVVQQGGSSPILNRDKATGGEKAHADTNIRQVNTQPMISRSALTIGRPNDSYEREADAVADNVVRMPTPGLLARKSTPGILQRSTVPLLQRRLVVNPADSIPLAPGEFGPPTPLTFAIQGLIGDTCPDGQFAVDSTTGNVTSSRANFCDDPPPAPPILAADVSSTPVGCGCLCDVINHALTTTIAFRAGGPGTTPVGATGTGPGSPTVRADPRFQGQYRISGRWVDIPFHLILAHEICGHALDLMRGTQVARGPGPRGGTPPHERRSVDVERDIAAEHNPPLPRRPEDYSRAARKRP